MGGTLSVPKGIATATRVYNKCTITQYPNVVGGFNQNTLVYTVQVTPSNLPTNVYLQCPVSYNISRSASGSGGYVNVG